MLPAPFRPETLSAARRHAAEAGFFGPESQYWRVARENVLTLAGPAALLLQLAHPLVSAGVAQHSDFQQDPLGRLKRTFEVIDRIIFGSQSEACQAAVHTHGVHRKVTGRLTESAGSFERGSRYSALQPELLLWVHATLVDQSLSAYQRFVGPLSQPEKKQYYEEGKRFASLFGVSRQELPPDLNSFRLYYQRQIRETLAVGKSGMKLRHSLLKGFPQLGLFPFTYLFAAGMLPDRVRHMYRLNWNRGMEWSFQAASAILRRLLPILPPQVRYDRYYRKRLAELGLPR